MGGSAHTTSVRIGFVSLCRWLGLGPGLMLPEWPQILMPSSSCVIALSSPATGVVKGDVQAVRACRHPIVTPMKVKQKKAP